MENTFTRRDALRGLAAPAGALLAAAVTARAEAPLAAAITAPAEAPLAAAVTARAEAPTSGAATRGGCSSPIADSGAAMTPYAPPGDAGSAGWQIASAMLASR